MPRPGPATCCVAARRSRAAGDRTAMSFKDFDTDRDGHLSLDEFKAQGKDDLAFVDELLDLLIGDYCADDNRVYATGMSGGGIFASRLVCDMSDRIAAAVSVAALVYSETC